MNSHCARRAREVVDFAWRPLRVESRRGVAVAAAASSQERCRPEVCWPALFSSAAVARLHGATPRGRVDRAHTPLRLASVSQCASQQTRRLHWSSFATSNFLDSPQPESQSAGSALYSCAANKRARPRRTSNRDVGPAAARAQSGGESATELADTRRLSMPSGCQSDP